MLNTGNKVDVKIPFLHPDQVKAFRLPGKRKAIRAGRRWGKTGLATAITCSDVCKGRLVGIFAPDYQRLAPHYLADHRILEPITLRSSENGHFIRCRTGGEVEFWTLDDESAGRSRKYHRVIIDEAAFTKPNMIDIWEQSIEPTLLDYDGSAIVMSNTNGIDEENFFWQVCNVPRLRFVEFHAPSINNPHVPERTPGDSDEDHMRRRIETFERIRSKSHPLVYQQEYLAEFVSFKGDRFFNEDLLLVNGQPVALPKLVDYVFATIDTAVKDGREHDSTAVVYWGRSQKVGHPLVILDWDVVQIEGALLETWLPNVYRRLDELTKKIRCMFGSKGVFIEDKQSGSILLQQARRKNWLATPLSGKLTDLGKDGRAIAVSTFVQQGMVKFFHDAFFKVTNLKGIVRNHMRTQIENFRIADKDAYKRPDDLLDCFTYGIAVALGNAEDFE